MLRTATALALFLPLSAIASECRVQAGVMPDARTLQRMAAERAEGLARTQAPPQVSVQRAPVASQHVMRPAPAPAADLPWIDGTPAPQVRASERVEQRDARENRPLIRAVDAGDAKLVAALLAGGEDVRRTERDGPGTGIGLVERAVGRWLLSGFASGENLAHQQQKGPAYAEIVHRLLEAGADPSLANGGSTALGRIARGNFAGGNQAAPQPSGALAVATDLLEHGAQVGPELELAAARDDRALLALMLTRGRPAQKDKDRALVMALQYESRWAAAKVLVENGADPNVVPTSLGLCCDQPLLDALMVRPEINRGFIKFLLAHGLRPDVMLRTGSTALMQVLHDTEMMQAFIDRGAQLNTARKQDGNTVLHLAARSYEPSRGYGQGGFPPDRVSTPQQRAATVALLLRRGADPNVRNAEGLTPLMIAADDAAVVRALLDAGARVEPEGRSQVLAQRAREYGGEAAPVGPVGWALMERKEALAVELARRGALDPRDCGALHYAASGGAVRALAALLDARAPADVRDSEGRTPLIAAAGAGHVGAVRLLLDRRAADVNEVTRFAAPQPGAIAGASALMAAAATGYVEVVRLLLSRGAKADQRDRVGRGALEYAHDADQQREEVEAALRTGGAVDRTATRGYPQPGPSTPFQAAAARELLGLLDPGGKTVSLSPQPVEGILLPGDDSSVETIPCEDVAAFSLYAHAGEQGSIIVGRCRASASRIRQLAPLGDRHLQSFAKMLGKQLDPAEMRKAGWYYAKSAVDGGEFHFYPTLLVGHGILAVHNGVRLGPSGGAAIVVQLAGYPMCDRDPFRSSAICAGTEDTLRRLASAIARVP